MPQPVTLRILHVGCGGDALPEWIAGSETRLDIDPTTQPDVVASMTDMGQVGVFDLVYCSHALEHLAPHEVPLALSEFKRVLSPHGKVIIIVPDLEGVQPTDETLFDSPAGPISGHDLFYGMRSRLEKSPQMAHRTGFVAATLGKVLGNAGFAQVNVKRVPAYNLIATASK